jgi:glucose-1-phosphate thymidylyltransferase
MKALILAAGYATRLYPLTREYPKSLLPVNGSPIIDHIIDGFARVDEIEEFIVITNNKFFRQFKAWQGKHRLKKKISIVNDLTCDNATRLGAIGDMDFALDVKRIKKDLLVIGGDNLFNGCINRFLSFSRKFSDCPVIGAYDIKKKSEASKYGVIKLDKSKRVIDFQEKPKDPKSTLVAMCLYYFPKRRLGLIKEYLNTKTRIDDAMGFYIDWLRNRVPVYGYVFSGKWFDIGDHKFYNAAKNSFAK